MLRVIVSAGLMAAFSVTTAFAQTGPEPVKTYPAISGSIPIEVQNDWTFRSDDRANQNNDLYTKIEPEITVAFSPSWSIYAHAVLEPIGSPRQFENRAFEDHGLFIEDLFLEYSDGTFGARAGKLNVGFGIGWDKTPGLYGSDFAEDGYETSERIGLIGSYSFNAADAGTHRLSAGSFFRDTTPLSQSIFRGRGDTRKQDGGVSNTESFRSFIIALDGGGTSKLGKLGYHAAYMHQASGTGDAEDEDSFAVALFTALEIGRSVTFSPMVEYVYQDSPGGVAGQNRAFLTLAGQMDWNGFNLAVAWTGRDTDNGTNEDDFRWICL